MLRASGSHRRSNLKLQEAALPRPSAPTIPDRHLWKWNRESRIVAGPPAPLRRRANRETDARARAPLPRAGRYAPRADAHTEHTFSPFTSFLTAASAFRAKDNRTAGEMRSATPSVCIYI
jgi:hypothetical protein